MKVLSVVGARPQFIKAASVSRAMAHWPGQPIQEVLVHTGQHHDDNMSQVFFDDLGIPAPAHNLMVAGGGHGDMTGRMLQALEPVMLAHRPDWVLVYGDTNSTLAAALAGAKLHIALAHVEAGLRSFNKRMPEEINRAVADRVCDLLLCPTDAAVANLAAEGRRDGVFLVGDVMYDAALFFGEQAHRRSHVLDDLRLGAGDYALATCHRAENTDDPARLAEIFRALGTLSKQLPVVLPLHPRTRRIASEQGLANLPASVRVLDPLPYLDMVALERSARLILTDSGGVQKEAYFFRVPCLTLRAETEWVETVAMGWNRLVPGDAASIVQAALQAVAPSGTKASSSAPYGDGHAAEAIVKLLLETERSHLTKAET
jgi:UDP-GlcNAc3NAcA epimerase